MAQDRSRTIALQHRSFEFTCGVIDAYPRASRIDDASRLIWRQLIKAARQLAAIFATIIVNKKASMLRFNF